MSKLSCAFSELKMTWKRVSRKAGLHEKDKAPRLRFARQLLRDEKRVAGLTMMSDEKIFASEESQRGGWWCSPRDADPTRMTWQGDAKVHVWGGVTSKGPLPLIFLKGGTFKGQSRLEADTAKLLAKKASQKVEQINFCFRFLLTPLAST